MSTRTTANPPSSTVPVALSLAQPSEIHICTPADATTRKLLSTTSELATSTRKLVASPVRDNTGTWSSCVNLGNAYTYGGDNSWSEALTVAGFLTDGSTFLGTSTVRIIHPGMKVLEDLASCWLQGDCVHPTWCDRIDMNRDSLVNLLDYALLMNIEIEFVTDE